MQRDSIYYLLFSTIHDVLKAEKRLKETTFDFELVPVPRHLSSDCVVFIKKDHTQIRALVGDGFGLYLVCRRFEGGRLGALLKFAEEPSAKTVSTGELSLLLEGSSFTVHKTAKPWRPAEAARGELTKP